MSPIDPSNVEKMKAAGDMEGLIKALDHEMQYYYGWSYAQEAVKALVDMKDTGAVAPLVAMLNKHPGQRPIADVLDKLGWQPGKDESGGAYWAAKKNWARCIEIGAPAAKPIVAIIASEHCGNFRDQNMAMQNALEKIGAAAIEPLIAALKDNVSHYRYAGCREELLAALGRAGASAIEPLISALKDDDSSVRYYVGQALQRIGPVSVEPLLFALKNEDKNVRSAAIDALKGFYKNGSLSEADKKSILAVVPDAGYVSPFASLHSDHSDDHSGLSGDGLVEICQH